MVQALPVIVQTRTIQEQGVIIYYPEVIHLPNPSVQQKVNTEIFQHVQQLVRQQHEQQGVDRFTEMIGTFELKTNERNVLSLTLSNYAYAEHHAHGLTLMNSLTFDISTGKTYVLGDLFKQGSNYVSVISDLVKNQIKTRDIPILNSFSSISPDQFFYIADQVLVIYFQAYEITPGYVGIPMFPIPVFMLEDIVTEDGPLGRMMASI